MSSRELPLAVWAGVLSTAGVLAAVGATGAVLAGADDLSGRAITALRLGAAVGLCCSTVTVLLVRRAAAALHALREEAVDRLRRPSSSLDRPTRRPLVTRASSELADLGELLEALHLRVRLGDQLGERHRLQAETAGAGVVELLSGLVAAEEHARGQLAAELHDTVAQSLMLARGLLAADAPAAGDLARVRDLVDDAEEQVRAVLAHTRPPALRDGDLAAAVDNLRLDLQARYGLDVSVRWPRSPQPLPLASAVTIYRFVQEALLNVVKHADVDRAALELEVTPVVVRATVVDGGLGFAPDAVRTHRGRQVGLALLGERARLCGGSLEVRSEPGVGTTLVLELPRVAYPGQEPPARSGLQLAGH